MSAHRRGLSLCLQHTFFCLLAFSCVHFIWVTCFVQPPIIQTATLALSVNQTSLSQPIPSETRSYSVIELLMRPGLVDSNSLTAILPVTYSSLREIEAILEPFLNSGPNLREVIVTCPESILSETRRLVRKAVIALGDHSHLDLSLRPWIGHLDKNVAVTRAASQVTTDWMLLLDDTGLLRVDNQTRKMLLNPQLSSFLVDRGSRTGSSSDGSCAVILDLLQPYLLPPFVMPTALFPPMFSESGNVWTTLSKQLSESLVEGLIENVTLPGPSSLTGCHLTPLEAMLPFNETQSSSNKPQTPIEGNRLHTPYLAHPSHAVNSTKPPAVFALLFPSTEDIESLSSLVCKLLDKGYTVDILLTDQLPDTRSFQGDSHEFVSEQCLWRYDMIPTDILRRQRDDFIAEWMGSLTYVPDVIITLAEDELTASVSHLWRGDSSFIRLSRTDLIHCLWMSTLSVVEWKHWSIPRIDISIITDDRPHSLERLLSSLTKGIFYGDTVNVRVNLEQSSDSETKRIAESILWEHGDIFVHHRVILGGLLPAVVESWYPQSNDTYGLLLEDDVELSPFFYAWIKMAVLRYRYGEETNRSPQLFGISLYQQKVLELKPEGRRPFNARTLFSSLGIQPTLPYLSQIPCSWGAVYFPQHWKEFHEYLSWRLSESAIKLSDPVVPNVRSNKWTKSWKKYFIELSYLRGYVMLYPNYEHFVSLSTNHVEVGSHVKDRSEAKREQFLLPLMKLPNTRDTASIGLLDLPGNTLPGWSALPILNLTGSPTSLETLISGGLTRSMELSVCISTPHNVRDPMCTHGNTFKRLD